MGTPLSRVDQVTANGACRGRTPERTPSGGRSPHEALRPRLPAARLVSTTTRRTALLPLQLYCGVTAVVTRIYHRSTTRPANHGDIHGDIHGDNHTGNDLRRPAANPVRLAMASHNPAPAREKVRRPYQIRPIVLEQILRRYGRKPDTHTGIFPGGPGQGGAGRGRRGVRGGAGEIRRAAPAVTGGGSRTQARQDSRPLRMASRGRSTPIKTILVPGVSSPHLAPMSLPISWCTPWNTTLRSTPSI